MNTVEILLEGPGKNALGTALLTHLSEALTAAGDAPILLTGAGDAFSAGLDLREVASLQTDAMERFLRLLVSVVEQLFRYPGPTVAAVNGHAIAGGCILAAVCDHRIATTDTRTRIGINEVALGLRFPPGLLGLLRYRVPRLETAVLGSELHAPQGALALGLIDELADDVLSAARARLAVLAAHPARAYAESKHDLRRMVTSDPEDEQRFLREVLPIWTGDELRARITSFLSRSKKG